VEPGQPTPVRFQFGVFEADPQLGVLTRQGMRVPLQDLPFRALVMLLERPGELVTREEMRQRLWPRAVVDFDHGLNKAINKIRDVLGDSATSPRFIETAARRGYRFLADVSVVDPAATVPEPSLEPVAGAPTEPGSPRTPETEPVPDQPSGRVRLWAILGAVFVTLLVLGGLAGNYFGARRSPPPVRSLAVLPLQNFSGDPSQDYFADGMTDELITQLAQIRALRVISRSSAMDYKNAHKSLSEIARELNVQAIVEGSVVTSGPHVRITAQLIRVPDDEHIWANSYEGDLRETLKLQNEVARAIATQVRVTLSPDEQAALRDSRQVDPGAHEAYMKGQYFWNKRTQADLRSAIDYFANAVALDPSYAEAYVGLADSYALAGDWEYGLLAPQEAWPKAIAAARKALQLDERLGEAHASLAFALDSFAWDRSGAEAEYQQALLLSPNYATAYHWHGFHLLIGGHHKEAIAQLRKAESLDPLSLIIGADIADALCIAHLYDQSIEQSNKILAMDPNFAVAHYELGQALEQKHRHEEAITHFQRAIELGGHTAVFDSNLAYAYAASGRREEAVQIVKSLEAQHDLHPTAYANIALAYAGLGDADSAMVWLEKAYSARTNPSILLRPTFDVMRSDERFKSLLRRMGIPDS
jgi:TolB-like protein/DNA-binding winged helix-turn-helix (wHTH) protein/Tfp pilus assembly protein PilF